MAYAIEFEESVTTNDIPAIPMPYREQIKKAIRERLTQEPVKLGKPLRYSLWGYRRFGFFSYSKMCEKIAMTWFVSKYEKNGNF